MSEIKLNIGNNILSRISWFYFRGSVSYIKGVWPFGLVSQYPQLKKKSLIDLSDFEITRKLSDPLLNNKNSWNK